VSNEHHLTHVNRHKVKVGIILIFLILVFVIIYTSIYGGFSFIGKAIMGDSSNETILPKITISANLDKIPLSIKGEFLQVKLIGSSDSFLYVGDEKFSLEASENSIIIDEFNGDISFDIEEISELKGKALQVSVNGVSISPSSKDTIKIYFEEPFIYDSVNIDEGVSIKEINYKTSGEIRVGEEKTLIYLNDEDLIIKDFDGGLVIGDRLNMEGNIESLETKGAHNIYISS
jgi:hypothetical protein